MKFYIATSLSNHLNHNRLRDALLTRGHEITYDWTQHGPVWPEGLDRVREVAFNEFQGVEDADVVIVLCPGGRGTHIEMGVAIATYRPIVLISADSRDHEVVEGTCSFYHLRSIYHYETIEDYLNEKQLP